MALFKYFPPHSAPQLAKLHRFADIAARVLLERRLSETGDWDPPSTEKKRWAKTAEVMGQQLRKRMGQDASIQFLILGESGMFLQNCLRKNNC